jgi:hypothetical protein
MWTNMGQKGSFQIPANIKPCLEWSSFTHTVTDLIYVSSYHGNSSRLSRSYVHGRWSRFEYRWGRMGFMVHKVALGQFSPSSSVTLTNHSTESSTHIICHSLMSKWWRTCEVDSVSPHPKKLKAYVHASFFITSWSVFTLRMDMVVSRICSQWQPTRGSIITCGWSAFWSVVLTKLYNSYLENAEPL